MPPVKKTDSVLVNTSKDSITNNAFNNALLRATLSNDAPFVVPRLRQISSTTYEVDIKNIRTANQIFLEHKSFRELISELQSSMSNYKQQVRLLQTDVSSLQQDKADLQSIIDAKNTKIKLDDTYHKSQIKKIRRQRNKAYIATGLTIIGAFFLVTAN